jgi:hypothetical protein
MIKKDSIFKILLFVLVLFSCSKESNKLKNDLNVKFNNLIQQSKAEKFKYKYDGLSPQSSYFVDCKLKFLSLTKNGELSSTTELIQFENDSVSEIYQFNEIYEEEDNGGRNFKRKADRILIIDFSNKTEKIFFKNKLIEERKILKSSFKEFSYLYKVKKITEENYNCNIVVPSFNIN